MAKKEKVGSEDLKNSQEIVDMMATEAFKEDFSDFLRIRQPLLYTVVNEEKRFLTYLEHYAKLNSYEVFTWDCFQGLVKMSTDEIVESDSKDLKDPLLILEHILNEAKSYVNNLELIERRKTENIKGYIYVLLDFHRFIGEDPDFERRLKSIAHLNGIVSTVLVGNDYTIPNTLENLIPMIDFPFPNKDEIKDGLYQIVNGVSSRIPGLQAKTKEKQEDLINAVSGLTFFEAQNAFAKSVVRHQGWEIPKILKEKSQIISKSGILEFFAETTSLEDVGGLTNLIEWIQKRGDCFTEEAEKYGIEKPRGLLTLGLPGVGKSLVCKAIAGTWEMPLLRLDFGKLFDSLVGQSEARTRNALKLAEVVSPCILWIDEIEKGLSGVSSSGRTGGGTTSRVLSTFLTWMQEKKAPVFVVATANDHSSIPPEFLRAGRFDEIFFVDLPNEEEKMEILSILLRKKGYNPNDFELYDIAKDSVSKNFSGAEIEKAIANAMLDCFEDGRREVKTNDIVKALKGFKSLYEIRSDDFIQLQDWAKDTQCMRANKVEIKKAIPKTTKVNQGKNLDLD